MSKLNKEECIKRLDEARYRIQPYRYVNEALEFAIKELRNPPLKWEELKEGMWVWDNQYKDYVKFERHDIDDGVGKVLILSKGFDDECVSIFRENRYFRKQVE